MREKRRCVFRKSWWIRRAGRQLEKEDKIGSSSMEQRSNVRLRRAQDCTWKNEFRTLPNSLRWQIKSMRGFLKVQEPRKRVGDHSGCISSCPPRVLGPVFGSSREQRAAGELSSSTSLAGAENSQQNKTIPAKLPNISFCAPTHGPAWKKPQLLMEAEPEARESRTHYPKPINLWEIARDAPPSACERRPLFIRFRASVLAQHDQQSCAVVAVAVKKTLLQQCT